MDGRLREAPRPVRRRRFRLRAVPRVDIMIVRAEERPERRLA